MYRLEVNEKQLSLIGLALEEYARVRIGQFHDLANDIAFMNFDSSNYTKEEFNTRIANRDEFQETTERLYRKMFPRLHPRTEECDTVLDMWQVIRHQQWLDMDSRTYSDVRSREAMRLGTEPLIKIENQKEREERFAEILSSSVRADIKKHEEERAKQ